MYITCVHIYIYVYVCVQYVCARPKDVQIPNLVHLVLAKALFGSASSGHRTCRKLPTSPIDPTCSQWASGAWSAVTLPRNATRTARLLFAARTRAGMAWSIVAGLAGESKSKLQDPKTHHCNAKRSTLPRTNIETGTTEKSSSKP